MNSPDLAGLRVFLCIAQNGSFRAAARELGVNPPSVSQRLKAFEDRLGVTLFNRSTRSVSLTEAGQVLLDRSFHHVQSLQDAFERARTVGNAQTGTLKVTLPYRAWQLIIAPRLGDFQSRYPGVRLDLSIDEDLVDIHSAGLHAGIRLGDHLQDGMIAVRISEPQAGALVCAPSYLQARDVPTHPSDLLQHECILHRQIRSGRVAPWRFSGEEGEYTVSVSGSLVVDDLRTAVDAAIRGFGIAWSLRTGVEREIADGALVEVLPGHPVERPAFYLYYPRDLADQELLRVLIEYFRV